MCTDQRDVWLGCGHSRRVFLPCQAPDTERKKAESCCFGRKKRNVCELQSRTVSYPGPCLRCACSTSKAQTTIKQVHERQYGAPADSGRYGHPRTTRPARGRGCRDSYIEHSLYAGGMKLMPSEEFKQFMTGPVPISRPARPAQVRRRPARIAVPPHASAVSVRGSQFDSTPIGQAMLFSEVEAMWMDAGRRT